MEGKVFSPTRAHTRTRTILPSTAGGPDTLSLSHSSDVGCIPHTAPAAPGGLLARTPVPACLAAGRRTKSGTAGIQAAASSPGGAATSPEAHGRRCARISAHTEHARAPVLTEPRPSGLPHSLGASPAGEHRPRPPRALADPRLRDAAGGRQRTALRSPSPPAPGSPAQVPQRPAVRTRRPPVPGARND